LGELDLVAGFAVELLRVHLRSEGGEPGVIRHQRVTVQAVGVFGDDFGVLPRHNTQGDRGEGCRKTINEDRAGVYQGGGAVFGAVSELGEFGDELDPFDPARRPGRTTRGPVRRCLPVEVVSRVGDASGPDRRQHRYLLIEGGDLFKRDPVRVRLEGWSEGEHANSQTVATDIGFENATVC
jgi:hypothetical protein